MENVLESFQKLLQALESAADVSEGVAALLTAVTCIESAHVPCSDGNAPFHMLMLLLSRRKWENCAQVVVPHLVAMLLRKDCIGAMFDSDLRESRGNSWIQIVQALVTLPDVVMPLIGRADAELPQRLYSELGFPNPAVECAADWWEVLTPEAYFRCLCNSLMSKLWFHMRASVAAAAPSQDPSTFRLLPRARALCSRLVALGRASDLINAAFTVSYDQILLSASSSFEKGDAAALASTICSVRILLAATLSLIGAAPDVSSSSHDYEATASTTDGAGSETTSYNDARLHSWLPQLSRQLLGLIAQACEEPVAGAGARTWTTLLSVCWKERAALFPQLSCSGLAALLARLDAAAGGNQVIAYELRVATLLRCLLGPALAMQSLCVRGDHKAPAVAGAPVLQALCDDSQASAAAGQALALQPWLVPLSASSSDAVGIAESMQIVCGVSVERLVQTGEGAGLPVWLVGGSRAGARPAATAALVQSMLLDVFPARRVRGTLARGFLDFCLWDVLPSPVACAASSGFAGALQDGASDVRAAGSPIPSHTVTSIVRPCVWRIPRGAACASDAACPSAVVAAIVQLLTPVAVPAFSFASTSTAASTSVGGSVAPGEPVSLTMPDSWVALLRPDAATEELLGASVRSSIAGLPAEERPAAAASSKLVTPNGSSDYAAGVAFAYALPLQELAARWASPHFAAAAESGVQASFGRVITHLLQRLPPVLTGGSKVRLSILMPRGSRVSSALPRALRVSLPPPLPLLLPTLTSGVSVRMEHASSAVRGGALRIARAFSTAMTTQVKRVRHGRDTTRASAAGGAHPPGAEEDAEEDADEGEDEEDDADLDEPEPGLPALAPLSFAGDADVRDDEDEAEAAAQDALDAQAALVLAGLSTATGAPSSVASESHTSEAVAFADSEYPLFAGSQPVSLPDAAVKSGSTTNASVADTKPKEGAATNAPSAEPTRTGAAARKPFTVPRISVQAYVATGRAIVRAAPARPTASSATGPTDIVVLARGGESAVAASKNSSGTSGGAVAAHTALALERSRAAAAAAEDAAAADSPFLRRALQLAARAPTDLFGTTARLARARFGGAGAPSGAAALQLAAGGSAGSAGAAASSSIMLSAGDDGGAVSILDTLRSESDHEGAAAALVALPRLVRASAADPRQREALVSAAPALLRALLSLDDRFGLPDFGLWRFAALTSLASVALPLVAPHLLRTLFAAGELSEGVRLEALDVLVAAAREVAGADPPVIPEAPWELAMRLWRAARVAKLAPLPLAGGSAYGEGPSAAASAALQDRPSPPTELASSAGAGAAANMSRASAPAPPLAPAKPNRLAGLAADAIFYPLLRGVLTGSPAQRMRSSRRPGMPRSSQEVGGDAAAAGRRSLLQQLAAGGGGAALLSEAGAHAGASAGAAAGAEEAAARLLDGGDDGADIDIEGMGSGLSDTGAAFAFARSPRMLTDGSSAVLLAQSIRTLSVLLELSRVHASAGGMARSLLALAWGVREHVDAGVRRACLAACAAVIAAVWTNAMLAEPSVLFLPSWTAAAAGAGANGAAGSAAAASAGASAGSTLSPAVACLLPAHLRLGYEQAAAAQTERLLKASRPEGPSSAPSPTGNTTPADVYVPSASDPVVPQKTATAVQRHPIITELDSSAPGPLSSRSDGLPVLHDAGSDDEDDGQRFTRHSAGVFVPDSAAERTAPPSPHQHAFVSVIDVSADGGRLAEATDFAAASDAKFEFASAAEGGHLSAAPGVMVSLTSVARRLQRSAQLTALLSTGPGGSLGVSSTIRGGTDRALAEEAAASLLRRAGMGASSETRSGSSARSLEDAAGEALLASLISGGATTTMWDDLQEVVAHLCAVENGDPDADNRVLAAALLNNEITRTLVMRPLQLLDELSAVNMH